MQLLGYYYEVPAKVKALLCANEFANPAQTRLGGLGSTNQRPDETGLTDVVDSANPQTLLGAQLSLHAFYRPATSHVCELPV